jgi:restriction system protein
VAIPDFQTFMRPVLAFHADGHEHRADQVREAVAAEFRLTDEDRRVMMSSGRVPLHHNRIAWAVTYLAQARSLERTRRGYTTITQRGRELLQSCPDGLSKQDLERFPEFVEFLNRSRNRPSQRGATNPPAAVVSGLEPNGGAGVDPRMPVESTPEEVIDAAYREHRSVLVGEMLDRIKKQSPEFFEALVLDVLTAMGYGGSRADAAERLGRTGDGGIDGIVREDALGLDVIYVQAKRWDGSVGRPVIQGFVGALHGAHAEKGVLITTSSFTTEALRYADSVAARVILLDGEQLAGLMIDYDVGVTETTRIQLKRIDSDYFLDDVAAGIVMPAGPAEVHRSGQHSQN